MLRMRFWPHSYWHALQRSLGVHRAICPARLTSDLPSMRLLQCVFSLTLTAAAACFLADGVDPKIGPDECIVIPGAGGVGCATAEGFVRDSAGRPMPAAYMSFAGSLTPGRVGRGSSGRNITDGTGHYQIRTMLQGDNGVAVPDTATVWIMAERIDTLPSGVTIHGPRDSVAAVLRFGPAGPTTPRSEVPTVILPSR